MKLGKEEIQKIFLSVLLLIGLLYCYFTMLLGPLSKDETNARNTVASLVPQIDRAKAAIKDVAAREKSAPAYTKTIDEIKSLIPEGAPIAWFPPMITGFFKNHGLDKTPVHAAGEAGEKDLAGFKRISWSVDIPRVEVSQLGKVISDLENEHPLLEITSLHIDALKENPQYQHASLSLSIIVKQ